MLFPLEPPIFDDKNKIAVVNQDKLEAQIIQSKQVKIRPSISKY